MGEVSVELDFDRTVRVEGVDVPAREIQHDGEDVTLTCRVSDGLTVWVCGSLLVDAPRRAIYVVPTSCEHGHLSLGEVGVVIASVVRQGMEGSELVRCCVTAGFSVQVRVPKVSAGEAGAA